LEYWKLRRRDEEEDWEGLRIRERTEENRRWE
jgi:hypothetical protein